MPKLKSHRTVEEIAKKHRLDVSFIQKQLEMGEPIEHEHTKDHDLAKDIALQHLDEIPDYYTRLKKMESDAKKHHKKFKDVKEETKSGDEGLHDWFNKSKSSDGKSGWVQLGGKWAGKPCARQPGQTSTPKCGSSKMKRNLNADQEETARVRKNREDPNQPRKTGSAKPTNVRTEEMELQEVKDKPSKGSGKKDACYNKVKSRYDVWPSAYASGALVKCRKVGAANWGTKSEETMHEEERYCPLCDKRETRSECSYGEKAWDRVSVKDEEYSMARSELKTIEDAVKRLKAKVGKGEGDLEAWVQSKITKAADYIDTAADYIASGEMEEGISFEIDPKDIRKSKRSSGIRNLSLKGSTEGERNAAQSKRTEPKIPLVRKGDTSIKNINAEYEPSLVDKIMDEMKCWPGYKKKGTQELFGKKYNRCVEKEDVTIEDADGNTFAEVVDIIKPEPIKGFKSQVEEATRLQAQTGNVIGITLSWRGKYYSLKMFFPQVKIPTRKEINDELQKVYPGCNVIYHSVSELQPGQPLIQPFGPQGGSPAKPGSSKSYVKPMGEEVEVDEKYVPWDFGPKQKAKSKFDQLTKRKKEEVSAGISGGKRTATRANRISAVGREMRITLDKDSAATGSDPKKQGLQPSTKRHTDAARRGAGGRMTARKLYSHFEPEGGVLEDWQKINRQDKTDGLSPSAVKAYRRENPGSKLKTAVTTPPSELEPGSADWKRRRNFCSRSRSWTGERGKAARKRWNCN
jgi:hypothetical protein